jgi:hypothetical protein
MAMIVMFVFGLAQFILVQIGYGYCDDEDSAFPNDICNLSVTKKVVLYYLPSGILLCANVSTSTRSRMPQLLIMYVLLQFWAFVTSCCLKEKLDDDDNDNEMNNYY